MKGQKLQHILRTVSVYTYLHRRQKGGKLHSFRKLYLGSLWAGSFVWLGKQSKKVSLALNFEVFFLNVVDGDTSVHVTMCATTSIKTQQYTFVNTQLLCWLLYNGSAQKQYCVSNSAPLPTLTLYCLLCESVELVALCDMQVYISFSVYFCLIT